MKEKCENNSSGQRMDPNTSNIGGWDQMHQQWRANESF